MYQDRIVKGTVTEKETGTPLNGASISIKGTNSTTVTNSAGQFEIAVASNEAILVFTYAGKKAEERAVAGLPVIDVALENEVALLEEVYVGYMVQKKKTLPGPYPWLPIMISPKTHLPMP
ncbi:carboxypeptidase-like regulatory domain-containing protein [Niabella hibiscisoli]|uniref:carboxypeptidase-like regulatory domain-containing protein n=1 Tax=Niabella hibiscisoli TaxID=1825928 RepID=UPI001F111845|nr:carboxypeptidase-like regulatory domain-containing protein [Niabella hibiscisoli]MCH5716602.1 carboxypeptidase-like regulatory domain-containing protein [Niabella hibiscisoli]